jgi:hypothetical protein
MLFYLIKKVVQVIATDCCREVPGPDLAQLGSTLFDNYFYFLLQDEET